MTKLCFIGHFGGSEVFRDGQTVKTHNIAAALKQEKDFRVKCVDTYFYKRNVLKFGVQLISGLASCERVVLCVSKGGRRVFFPLLYWCAKLLRKKVYHFSIGGRLAEEVQDNPNWKKYIQAFCVNWVESHLVEENLRSSGVTNAEYLPNFKQLPVVSCDELPYPQQNTRSFCMFSRITEEKGVTEAINAVTAINRRYGRIAATLDLYGPIDPAYKPALELLLSEHGRCIHYCAEAEPESSVDILRKYDILLFPTRRFREGIPGTVIDALCSGVPVISRKWKYCHEMLTHAYNGFCYDFDQPEKLEYWMEFAIEHPDKVFEMKKNGVLSADMYRTETVAPIICRRISEG